MSNELKLTDEELSVARDLLRQTADGDEGVAQRAMYRLAKAIELPLKKGFFIGDTVGAIYTREDLEADAAPKYPLDFVGPSGESQFAAYFIPDQGRIPERKIVGDEVTVDTFRLGNSIDWDLRYARVARWPLVERALRVFRDGFVMKINDQGWTNILGAAAGRLDLAYPSVAGGKFTLGFLSQMQLLMKRGIAFANSQLTDVYVSSEVMKDIRDFATDSAIDFMTRSKIFDAASIPDGNGGEVILPTVYGVRIHELKQLGVGQDYNTTFNTVKGSLSFTSSTDEVVVGLDLSADGRNAFMMPVREDLQVFDDPTLHRKQKAGVYGWMELGFAVLDNRRTIVGKVTT